jgi:hypothetical protein
VQVGQRRGPAPGGELPGAVHHVAFEDGPQGAPFGLEQRVPGGGQDVGGVFGHLVAGQYPLHSPVDLRLPPQRLGDLAVRLVRGGCPDPGEQVVDRRGQVRRDRGQEIGAPAGRMQRQDHSEVGLAASAR